jgi:hypothetical protein
MNSQPDKPVLRLDWCSHEAAKYAVEHWHYSRSLPLGGLVKVGVWESGVFIGCVIFAQGNNQHQGAAYGLTMFEVAELCRVALNAHANPVTRIVALSLKFLKQRCQKTRLVVSYADPEHGHHGGIYQGGNWVFIGTGGSTEAFYDASGNRIHTRTATPNGNKKQFGRNTSRHRGMVARRVKLLPKWKYLMPLDAEMRQRILPLAKPYPKRAVSDTKDTAGHHPAEGGSTPTTALQSESTHA